ncbi:UAP56-interacting factor isoform X3 [Oncorhynchus mykiss]|uniref:UAP56-interacting factor isoform X3 n=1 Tax=Oncorhynchus mykiss TaxID=8022 RepID=UPI00187827E2|nr:UAP56-interacting factor isoform X3 [Oncorhynchus mykiss]
MSNVGFSATRGISSGGPDKVDMSLGGGVPRGAITRVGFGRGRKIPPPVGRRRGQGVITGLAARKTAALQKGISPLNRPAINRKLRPFNNRSRPFNNRSRPFNNQSRPFIQPAQYRQVQGQRRPYRQTDVQRRLDSTRPFQQRRRPLPPVQTQREARQAMFLSRRGLKVHAQVPKPTLTSISPAPVRTRQWRTSTNSSGILTVSIDNPTAMTQSEPPCAWSLHPSAPTSSAPVKMKVEEEKKTEPPKGVPLQFDINSVGKPTAMTLNERFRLLKDERVATAQTSKGSRFVTVG